MKEEENEVDADISRPDANRYIMINKTRDVVGNFLRASNEKTNQLITYAKITDRKGVSTNFLEELYLKYSVNLEKYFHTNRAGMKLTGNKHFQKYPYTLFFQDQEDLYDEGAKEKDYEEIVNFEDKYFLTPLPNKSRQLLGTKKEVKDFQNAERVAVVMRTYEYTHGIRSKIGIEQYKQMLLEEQEIGIRRMKALVNKIQNWYKQQKFRKAQNLRNQKLKEEMESRLFKEKCEKYVEALKKKKKENGINKLIAFFKNKLIPLKQLFWKGFTAKSDLSKNEKFKGMKLKNRTLYNWYSQMNITSGKNIGRSFSIFGIQSIKIRVINKRWIVEKKVWYDKRLQFTKLILLQKRIGRFIQNQRKKALRDIIGKPSSYICYISKTTTSITLRINKIKHVIKKKIIYDEKSLLEYFFKWKENTNRIITLQKTTKKINSYSLILTKYFSNYLSKIKNKNLQNALNKLKSNQRLKNILNDLNKGIKSIAQKQVISTLEYKNSLHRLTFAVKLLIDKTSLYEYFNHWKNKVDNLYIFLNNIRQHSLLSHKNTFFSNLRSINKNMITSIQEEKKGGNNYDNNFRYYCIINLATNENDFYLLRISKGYQLASKIIIGKMKIISVFNKLKKLKKKKKLPSDQKPKMCEIIKLNPRLSSNFNQFRSKLEEIEFILLKNFKSDFFHRIILNHLANSSLHLDNEELITLLKLGKENTYQRVLNRVLDLNLTENECHHNEISLISYVKKFLNDSKSRRSSMKEEGNASSSREKEK